METPGVSPAVRRAASGPLTDEQFEAERARVLGSWPAGAEVDFDEAVSFHATLDAGKDATTLFRRGFDTGVPIVFPRTGEASLDAHIDTLNALHEAGADLLCTHADSYTRTRRFGEAGTALAESETRRRSLLNGTPVVNHGVRAMRRVTVETPAANQYRQGTPDGRLAAEIVFAAGYRSMHGGILGSVPHMRDMPIGECVRNWQYVDGLAGRYEAAGVPLHREYYGALMGMVMPPSLMCSCLTLDALLAAEQGVKHITVGVNNNLHLQQDVATLRVLATIVPSYLARYGYADADVTPMLHMWMGPFPAEPAKAYSIICLGSFTAGYGRAAAVVIKTVDEAIGCPTTEANAEAIRLTKACLAIVAGQKYPDSAGLDREIAQVELETRQILDRVLSLGDGAVGPAIEAAFAAGYIDIPLAPARCNLGRAKSARDVDGAVRYYDSGSIPFSAEVRRFNRERIEARAAASGSDVSYKMILRDFSMRAFDAPPLLVGAER